jgi:hypothetical protein
MPTACLKGVLPERAGVGVGQLAGSVVPVASGHIRYVVDVEHGETGSLAFVNNRPLTHPAEQNGGQPQGADPLPPSSTCSKDR